MKKLVLTLIVLVAAGVVFVRYFPERAASFVAGTPLKDYAATSKPVYQWRDEKGRWQATDEPPADGVPYEVKRYALDANLVPAFRRDAD
jgi:hypothetical protein